MLRFLRAVHRHAAPPHGLRAAVLLSRLRAGIASVLRRDVVSRRIGQWIRHRPVADPQEAASGANAAARAETGRSPQASMQNFADLIANAVNPSMSRDERESVYGVVRQAVLRLHQDRDALVADARIALQMHLVEETIRDLEADIARHNALERMQRATEAQAAEIGAATGRQG